MERKEEECHRLCRHRLIECVRNERPSNEKDDNGRRLTEEIKDEKASPVYKASITRRPVDENVESRSIRFLFHQVR